MKAKITAYNFNSSSEGCGDFSLNCYWGQSYKNVFYLEGDLGRSKFEDIIETETDATGQSERTQNTSIERFNLSVIATTPLLQFLKTIDKHDVKTIEFIDTGITYTIQNIDIDDTGDILTPNNLVYINFEDEAISKISPNIYTITAQKQAWWDNNNDGAKNVDGEAQFVATPYDNFQAWQLYFESNGTTPATTGTVKMYAYAVDDSATKNLIGIFTGDLAAGTLFGSSAAWQSNQDIWNYFGIANAVGHTNPITFSKDAFATANGYFSTETEDKAVDIKFEISIDESTPEPTTLAKVYSIWGAFASSGIQVMSTGEYGITTVGTTTEKNTISTIQDVKMGLVPSVAASIVTAPVLTSTTAFGNEYQLAIAGSGEIQYSGSHVTAGGYIGSNFRGSNTKLNFTLGIDGATAVDHTRNILTFTTGISPYIFEFGWKYDRQVITATLGDVNGTANCYLDGVVLSPPLAGVVASVIGVVTGTQSITLTDTNKHTIKLHFQTTTLNDIYHEFEVQIKPLY